MHHPTGSLSGCSTGGLRDRLSHWPDTVAMLALANIAIVIGAGLLLDITFRAPRRTWP